MLHPDPRPDARTRRRRLPLLVVSTLALTLAALVMPPVAVAWDGGTFSSAEEDTLLAWINSKRTQNGLAALPEESTLSTKARERAKDMADNNYLSHNIPPDNHDVFDELKADGYCYELAGEIFGQNNYPDDQSTAYVETQFWNSTAHRNAILGEDWTRVGMGAYKDTVANANGFVDKVYVVIFTWKCGDPGASTPAPTAAPTATPKPTSSPGQTPATTKTPTPVPTPTSGSQPTASAAPSAATSPTAGTSEQPVTSSEPAATTDPTGAPEPASSASPDASDGDPLSGAAGSPSPGDAATPEPTGGVLGLTDDSDQAGILGSLPMPLVLLVAGVLVSGLIGGGAILIGRRRPPSG